MNGNDFLSQASSRIDTSAIRKVFDLAAKIRNPLNLSIGQPDFPVPDAVKEAYIKAVRDDKNTYTQTQGILPLREAISERWSDEGFIVDAENIVVSTGTASILFLLFQTLFDPGDGLLMLDPYFLIYESMADYFQLDKQYISENFTKDSLASIKADNVKAIIFSSPSNPSGKILSKEQLIVLSNFARENDILLISDEIYEAYDYDNKFSHAANYYPEGTITLSGFSKSHAMTGLRVGYVGVPDNLKEISNKVATLQQYSVVCSPQPAQWAAITALRTPITSELALMHKRRDIVVTYLKDKTKFTFPDGAFYLFCHVPIDGMQFVEKAIEKNLLIVPGNIFSKEKNRIRISYAQDESILHKGLTVFSELLEQCQN